MLKSLNFIIDLNVKPKIIKLLKINIENLSDLDLCKDFFGLTSWSILPQTTVGIGRGTGQGTAMGEKVGQL